jgi:hypothetical protein
MFSLNRARKVNMPQAELLSNLNKSKPKFTNIAKRISEQPALMKEIFEGLNATRPRIKYGCAKVVRLMSEQSPSALYPHFDRVAAYLDSDNQILRWMAILAIGNMAEVDTERRIEAILPRYLEPIRGPVMITAANTIRSAAKIAVAMPDLADPITNELLRVEEARYQTSECRNVALGHAILALEQFFPYINDRARVLAMARRQVRNPRNATRRKAEKFLKHDWAAAA